MHVIMLTAIATPAPERALLACPVCHSQRVVLTHLACRALGSTQGEIQVVQSGLRIDPSLPHPEGGAMVGLRCACEHGHQTIIRFQQVRNATVVEHRVLPWTAHPTMS